MVTKNIEDGTIYVFRDKRTNETIKGYVSLSDGYFRYWKVDNRYWDSIEKNDYYMGLNQLEEMIRLYLIQLN